MGIYVNQKCTCTLLKKKKGIEEYNRENIFYFNFKNIRYLKCLK